MMFQQGQVLRTDADFENARLFATVVEVWRKGVLIEKEGHIKMYDDSRVHIRNGYFPRSVCEIRVSKLNKMQEWS